MHPLKNSIKKSLSDYYSKPTFLPYKRNEIELCYELSKAIGGRTEVVTPVGRIDLLNDDLIIEAKINKYWKQAIGQLMCYELYYERPYRGIAIIGTLPRYTEEVCRKLKLVLFHYNVNSCQWDLIETNALP